MDMGIGSIQIVAGDAPFTAVAEMGRIREAALDAGFAEWTDGICDERFAIDGAIPGRALRV
jgi:hypothetical protein